MSDYQQARDHEALPVYEFTDEFAQLRRPPPEMQQLLGAMRGNQDAMDEFVSVQAAPFRRRSSSRPRTSGESWPRSGEFEPRTADSLPHGGEGTTRRTPTEPQR